MRSRTRFSPSAEPAAHPYSLRSTPARLHMSDQETPPPPVVLVVEDHPELRQVLTHALTLAGYEALAVADESEALGVLRVRSVDLFIADLAESNVEPREVMAAVHDEFPELPLIVTAESRRDSDIFFGPWATSGTLRTLRKPFKLGDLIAASREALGELVDSTGP